MSAVGGFKNAALLVSSPEAPHGGYVNDFGMVGMDDDVARHSCLVKSHVLPRIAIVGGFVDPVAPRVGPRVGGLARSVRILDQIIVECREGGGKLVRFVAVSKIRGTWRYVVFS